jgi:hypothetical protein
MKRNWSMTVCDIKSWKLLKESRVQERYFNLLFLCGGLYFIAYTVFVNIKQAAFLGLFVYMNLGALSLARITVDIYTDIDKSKCLSSSVRSRKLYTSFLPFFAQLPCWLYMLAAVISCLYCRFMHLSLVWFWPELLSLCINNFIVCIISIPARRLKAISYYFIVLLILPIPLIPKRLSVYALPWWTRSTVPALFVCAALIVLTAVWSFLAARERYNKQ